MYVFRVLCCSDHSQDQERCSGDWKGLRGGSSSQFQWEEQVNEPGLLNLGHRQLKGNYDEGL